MASTPEKIAQPSITRDIALGYASKAFDAATERRRAYELGYQQSEAKAASSRQQAERWKAEAQWWREEHERVHREFSDFVLYVASELGLK